MGLSSKSSYFLSLINPTNAQELLSFNLKEYNLFLNNLLISFTQNSSIIPGLIDYISANWVSFDLEASTLSLLCISLYKLDEKAFNLLPNLLNQFYETLEGQQELETLRSTLTSHIFDVKMLLDSNNHFGFKGYDDKEKKFAGFQMIKPGFGDNNPEQNPVLNEFLLVLKRNLELERGITDINAFKSLKFNQFSRDYQPQLFTSLLEGSLYRAVFFLDTIQLDWEGNNLKEIWRLRFKTLETLEPTLKCDYISSNLVYQFGNDQKTVFLKPKSLLNGLINKILKGNDVFEPLKGLNGFSKVLMRFYNRNRKEIKGYKDRAILLKVVGELNEAGLMIKKANLASFKMLRGHYMEKSKLLLFLGYKAIHLLSKNLRKKLLKEINHVSPKGTQYTTIKSFYKSLILSLKSSETTETSSIKDILNENPWLGRRLSNELTAKTFNKEDATKDLDYEIIDLGFYNDKSYHQYKDWKQRLSSLTHNNLAFITPRLFSTCLFSSNQESKVSDVIGVIPEGNRLRDMIKPLSYRLMWEENLYQKSKGDNEKVKRYEGLAGVCQENIDKETRFIMNLQNFKYVLKKDFEVKEIGTLLNEFKFIDELIKEHLEGDLELNSKGFQKKVRRKGKDFIGYLNHPLRGAFINDYTRFMLKAALKKEDFNEMVKVRNSFRLYKVYKRYNY